MANENGIKKTDWVSSFVLVGRAKVNDYTFKIDAKSERSSWIYNSMNLGVDCGEKYGCVYSELMGGYSEDKENILHLHGKDDEGNEDWSKQIKVDFEDRFNEDVIEEVGDGCFTEIGLEKTTAGNVYKKKFLSAYDAIAYAQEHLTDGMPIVVRGRLQYSMYNDHVQVHKTIQRITLISNEENLNCHASFTQTILLDKDSASLKDIDKDKSVMYINARVLDYVKEINGVEIKGNYPYNVTFEYPMNLAKPDLCKKVYEKLFKVKKDVTQMTFEGDFVEGGAQVTATKDDIPEDIQELIDMEVLDEAEVLAKLSSGGSRERRMVLRKPFFKLVGEDKTAVLQKFEQRYTEDDLAIDLGEDEAPFEEGESSGDDSDMSWLEDL